MPTNSQMEEIAKEDGSKIERLQVEFTNGSLQQLRELGAFFGVNGDPSKVVELAISFLQNIKDKSTAKPGKDQTPPPEL